MMATDEPDYDCVQVAKVLSETDRAFLFRLESRQQVWVPKSVIDDPDSIDVDDEDIEVGVADWFVQAFIEATQDETR